MDQINLSRSAAFRLLLPFPRRGLYSPNHAGEAADGDARGHGARRATEGRRSQAGAGASAAGRTNFRIVHLSIQGNHIHLLCEADALAYVLNNWRKHRDDRGAMRTAQVDPYSTAVWFPAWAERDGVPFVWPKATSRCHVARRRRGC